METVSDNLNTAAATVIVDTGCANLTSVRCAVERLGVPVTVTRDHDIIRKASHVILPGVGTAAAAMKKLNENNLIELVQSLSQPVLGICLGMQLLTRSSQETHEEQVIDCLGLVPAHVSPLEVNDDLPLPHMGWNRLTDLHGPLFNDIPPGSHVYFVHSFAVPVGDYTLASSDYGQTFSAAINKDNFYGVQFHPERSGKTGAQIIKNFLAL